MSDDHNERKNGIKPRRRKLLKTVGVAAIGGTGTFTGITAGETTTQQSVAQQQTEWYRSFEHGYKDIIPVSNTNGGGAILVFDNLVKKLDESGNVQWTRSYGNPDRNPNINSITEASSGGFLIAGDIDPEEGNLQPSWIVKIASDGTKQWETTENLRGDVQAYLQSALDVIGTEDGGFVVAIGGYKTVSVVKVSEDVNTEWVEVFSKYYQSVNKTRTGDFLVSFGGSEHGLTKVGSEGTELWTKTYGPERYYTAPIDTGEGYLLAGTTNNYPYENAELLMKVAQNGTKEWEKVYDSLEGRGIADIAQGEGGGYLLAGYEDNDQDEPLPWVMHVDANGAKKWEEMFDYPTGIGYIYQLEEDGYLLGGGGAKSWVAVQEGFGSTPPDVNGDGQPARDPDGDGLYEDINGDGDTNVGDAQTLFSSKDSDPVQDNPDLFDFNNDQSLNVGDAQALFDEVTKE